MNKILIATILLFTSSIGLSHPVLDLMKSEDKQLLIGEGTWRAKDGVKDAWTGKMVISKWDAVLNNETGLKLTIDLAIHNGEAVTPVSNVIHYAIDRDLFIKIFDHTGFKPIGHGYCNENYCHFSVEGADGSKMEESWTTKEGLKSIILNGSQVFAGTNGVGMVFQGKFEE